MPRYTGTGIIYCLVFGLGLPASLPERQAQLPAPLGERIALEFDAPIGHYTPKTNYDGGMIRPVVEL